MEFDNWCYLSRFKRDRGRLGLGQSACVKELQASCSLVEVCNLVSKRDGAGRGNREGGWDVNGRCRVEAKLAWRFGSKMGDESLVWPSEESGRIEALL